jgi:small nuclear ribonucleoprotein (snRNP)-like protein
MFNSAIPVKDRVTVSLAFRTNFLRIMSACAPSEATFPRRSNIIGDNDPESPLEYVRRWFGSRISVLMKDGETIDGTLVAVDGNTNIYLKDVNDRSPQDRPNTDPVTIALCSVQDISKPVPHVS